MTALGPHVIEIGYSEPGLHGAKGPFVVQTTVEGCMCYPRGSTEEEGRESTTITGLTCLAPAGTVVDERKQIRHKGELYEVDGDVGEWDFMDGGGAAVQINLTRAVD